MDTLPHEPRHTSHGAHAIPFSDTSQGASWIEPGQRVRHPGRPDWGVGQVQSVVGTRVTVNFEHVGKQTMNVAVAPLDPVDEE